MGLQKGLIQVYTGNGKGKTTAALGQGMRAAGHGLKIIMVQFLKSSESGELKSAERFSDDFRIYRFESKKGFFWTLDPDQKQLLKTEIDCAMNFVKNVIEGFECDILILDEIAAVLECGLYEISEVLKCLHSKPDAMEIILTGRNMPDSIINAADLVTEMCEVKHYYGKGIGARTGIEK